MDEELKNTEAPAEEAAEAQEETAEAPLSPEAELQKKLDEMTAQYEQMRGIAARAQADGINYRNWAEREMKRLKAFGSERAVLALLPVFDNLERALQAPAGDAEALRQGVVMVKQQFTDALNTLGVTEVDPAGQPFSPSQHDAMGMVPVADQAQDGVVCFVVEKGFKIADKVIRPAKVMVGKYTAPAPEAEAPAQE